MSIFNFPLDDKIGRVKDYLPDGSFWSIDVTPDFY
jgi:hypothetical protein